MSTQQAERRFRARIVHEPSGADDAIPWRAELHELSADEGRSVMVDSKWCATRDEALEQVEKMAAFRRQHRAAPEEWLDL